MQNADAIKSKGVDTIAVTGVNDVFVMERLEEATGADSKVDFLADGNGEFAKAIDMTFDASGNGLGIRSKRYSMLVEDGVVKKLNIEEAPGKVRSVGRRRAAEAADRSYPQDADPRGSFGEPKRSPPRPARTAAMAWRARVGALVEIMAGMAAHPVPAHLMLVDRGIETLPQIVVLHRLAVGGFPAVALPLVDPAHDAVAQVLAVGVNVDHARPLERFQRRDRRHQLHAVVGRERLAALELLLVIAEIRIAPQPPGPGFPEQAPSV